MPDLASCHLPSKLHQQPQTLQVLRFHQGDEAAEGILSACHLQPGLPQQRWHILIPVAALPGRSHRIRHSILYTQETLSIPTAIHSRSN
jgi:hypothetical protein